MQAGGLDDALAAQDVVINATAASLAGAGSPVHARVIKRGGLALDMMYGPKAQAFLDWAAARRRAARWPRHAGRANGEAFFVWRGVRPDTAPCWPRCGPRCESVYRLLTVWLLALVALQAYFALRIVAMRWIARSPPPSSAARPSGCCVTSRIAVEPVLGG